MATQVGAPRGLPVRALLASFVALVVVLAGGYVATYQPLANRGGDYRALR